MLPGGLFVFTRRMSQLPDSPAVSDEELGSHYGRTLNRCAGADMIDSRVHSRTASCIKR
jgi:hypothetical protein